MQKQKEATNYKGSVSELSNLTGYKKTIQNQLWGTDLSHNEIPLQIYRNC